MQTLASNSASQKLPIELIHDIIADLAAQHDALYSKENRFFCKKPIAPGLSSCSLACRAWNYICQPHIFSTIVISGQINTRLSFLHFTSPHLYEYILDLRITIGTESNKALDLERHYFDRFTNLRALYIAAGFSTRASYGRLCRLGILPLISAAPLKRLVLHSWVLEENGLDLLHVLSACSNTLEDLTLDILNIFQEITGFPPPDLIACPNLQSLTIDGDSCDIPSWIPAGLSKLVLDVAKYVPRLGTTISPSDVCIICIRRPYHASYSRVIQFAGESLQCLPHPACVTQLTIKIACEYMAPRLEEYEGLCCAIQPLHSLGRLKRVNLSIGLIPGASLSDPWEDDAKEVAKLEKAFAPLLGDISPVDDLGFFTREHELEVIIRCA